MAGGRDKTIAREEFLAEAQELIEGLSRDLLLLDQSQRQGEPHPDTLNDLFRGVHTLKGLSGMFGFEQLGRLSHLLEDLLEDLRLGRVELNEATLDVLFQGVDDFQRLLSASKAGTESTAAVDFDAFGARIAGATQARQRPKNILDDYDFEPTMLAVLTEYEEHRLRSNLERGYTIYRMRVRLSLETIDSALEELKKRCKGIAEVITYLPSMEGDATDSIDIDLLLATGNSETELREALHRPDASLVQVQRRTRLTTAPSRTAAPQPTHDSVVPAAPDSGMPLAEMSLRSLTNVVRVDIRKLDYLMNVVGELGTVRSALGKLVERLRARTQLRELALEAHRIHRSFDRYLGEVQEGVLDVRMVPLSQLFDKLAVIVRQVARDQNKQVQLVVKGADTEVDKLIAEEVADPLMHIIRNAIDHGVESADDRSRTEKPQTATLHIRAYHKGNHVLIEVRDDGRGIDVGVIREAAIRKGLLTEQEVSDMPRDELLNVIFLPGFSTTHVVTDISGRGIGMDVVKTNITRLGGAVEVTSELGRGTTVTITLPVTLAIISALLFEVHGRTMSIPLAVVQEALKLDPRSMRSVEGREVLNLRGTTLPLCRLGRLFGFDGAPKVDSDQFVVVIFVGNRRLGLIVDGLAGQQDIVIKSLGKSLSRVQGFSGATDLGDQHLVLVLDASTLIEEALMGRATALSLGGQV